MNGKHYRIPLFYLSVSLFWFSLYTYVPTLSTYAKSLDISYKMVGLIIGSYGFTQMLLRIPLGILSDRLQRRKPFIQLGFICALVSALGMALIPGEGSLLAFRSLSGASAACWVPFTVLFYSYFAAEDSSKAMGYISSFTTLGQVVAVFLGGIVTQLVGQKWAFLLGAAGGIAGLCLSSGLVEKRDIDRKPASIQMLVSTAKDRNLLFFSVLAIFAQFITFATVYGFTPNVAVRIGASDFELGLLTALSALPGVFASALSGSFFAKRFGERKTLVFGFTASALFCIVIPYVGSLPLLYATQILGGFGQGVVFPLLMSSCMKNVGEGRKATAMGFFQAIYGLGMFTGPFLTGILIDRVGLTRSFWCVGAVGILAAALVLGKSLLKSSRIKT